MPWAVFAAAAALSAVGVLYGWPWGLIVAAACAVLPLAVTRLMLRPLRVWKEPHREPLHVIAVTLTPPVTVTQLPRGNRDQEPA
jgi:hypothetical protein